MKDFKTLVNLITKRGQKNIPLLYFNKDIEAYGKELELFLRTQSGEFMTDRDASVGIYDADEPDHRYKMLKSRVKQKMLNHLYFLDFEDEHINSSNKYEEECMRLLYFSRILINEGEADVAEKLLNKCLYLSQEGEFTYITISCLELLKAVHTAHFRPIHFKNVNEEIQHYRSIYAIEEEARDTYSYYKILLSKSNHSRKKNLENAEIAIQRMKKLLEKENSFEIFENYYQLRLLYLQLNGNFKEIIELTKEVDNDYEYSKLNYKRFNINLNKQMRLYAHLKAKDYTNGLKYAEKTLGEFSRSSVSWFAFMENYFLLAMHTKYVDLATNIIQKVTINTFFDKLPETDQERWNIYRGYLYFLAPDESLLKNYDYNRYFVDIPEFDKSKAGLNTAILVLQFLNYLKEDKIGHIGSPVEEYTKYVAKYCVESFSKRSKVFYKLLTTVAKCGHDIRTIKVKTKYLATKLKEIDMAGDVYEELEVLPYEQLWDIAIKYLKIIEVKAEL